jgi:hypothetical protein
MGRVFVKELGDGRLGLRTGVLFWIFAVSCRASPFPLRLLMSLRLCHWVFSRTHLRDAVFMHAGGYHDIGCAPYF